MPASQKKMLRILMKERREILFQQNPLAGESLINHFFDFFHFPLDTIIGGYWPIGSELDLKPLLYKLVEKGFNCTLPCITEAGLIFRTWTPLTPLEKKDFQIFEPPLTAPHVVPHVLLVPLLAYDKEGHRLGYGQGHYDLFLNQNKVMTIGVGFEEQEVNQVPRQEHDCALDYILTEKGVKKASAI